jgi:hypothetical protein
MLAMDRCSGSQPHSLIRHLIENMKTLSFGLETFAARLDDLLAAFPPCGVLRQGDQPQVDDYAVAHLEYYFGL